MNYFEFFELPVAPTVDQALLKKRFYRKSKAYHPDFHTLADADKQAEVLEMSSLTNQAYKTLADDDQRLKYFLELKEVLAAEGQNQVPQDFLMDIMDINENLMELEFDDDPELRTKTAALVETLERELTAQSAPLLEKYNADQPDDEQQSLLEGLRDYYLKHRYLLRIKEKI